MQHAAACFVLRGAATATPEPLGLAVEILPDLLSPGFLPGMRFSARVLAQGHPLTATTVHLERVGAEPVGTQVQALPDHGAPLWIVAETDREGRFRVSLPAPGLWAITATGPIGWSGLRPVRHVTTLWQRFGSPGQGTGKESEALAMAWETAAVRPLTAKPPCRGGRPGAGARTAAAGKHRLTCGGISSWLCPVQVPACGSD
ncbi:DUF4198 domain-containing protein [Rhodobacter capsulatus]|uniref:DUF4198 domain-containing protein n=1 Tax=Rhodobacter capsulatus TaxID=1061 RepID=UPI0040272D58